MSRGWPSTRECPTQMSSGLILPATRSRGALQSIRPLPTVTSSSGVRDATGEVSFLFCSKHRQYSIGRRNGRSFIEILFFNSVPEELLRIRNNAFTRKNATINSRTISVFFFGYGSSIEIADGSAWTPSISAYHVAPPLNFEADSKRRVPNLAVHQLADLLCKRKALFYTGAGISIAGGVAGLEDLRAKLQIKLEHAVDGFARQAITNPESLLRRWDAFVRAGRRSASTPAHLALTEIAIATRAPVFTENIDFFHERAGLKPIRVSRAWLTSHIRESWLADLDLVVTAGLARDDRGFLSWYKRANHKGQIVAINLKLPSYLSTGDGFLRGDVQAVLPELALNLIAVQSADGRT
jgi:hypothetical protein